ISEITSRPLIIIVTEITAAGRAKISVSAVHVDLPRENLQSYSRPSSSDRQRGPTLGGDRNTGRTRYKCGLRSAVAWIGTRRSGFCAGRRSPTDHRERTAGRPKRWRTSDCRRTPRSHLGPSASGLPVDVMLQPTHPAPGSVVGGGRSRRAAISED